MKGKCKKILSLAIVLAMVVQLVSGLGNVAKAASATEITITGLGGYSTSASSGSREQIGFLMTGASLASTDQWINATILGEGFLLNNTQQKASDGWWIRTTAVNGFALTKDGYTPTAGDVITLPQGMQIQLNAGSKTIYETTDDYTIKYDGSTWSEYVEATSLTISGRFTGTDSAAGASTTQLGLSTNETIDVYESAWLNCTMTLGNATLNGAAQSTWYIRITGAKNLNLACPNYTPAANDIIKIPAGTQFTYGTSVYEIAEDYTIKYDGTAWSEYVEATSLTISGRYINNDSTNNGTTQLGFSTNETIDIFESAWLNCTMTSGRATLNGAEQSTWYIRITGKNILNLACPNYTAATNDIIKIPAGTQFTYSTTGDVYEIAEDYTIQYDGTTWAEYVEVTPLTIAGRNTGNDATSGTIQIGLNTSETIAIFESDWLNCTTTSGSITLNDKAQSAWYIRIVGKQIIRLACPDYTPTANDMIKIPAGMQFTYGTSVYEIAEDYTIKYDGTTWSEYVEGTKITIVGRYPSTDQSTPQIGLSTNETIDVFESAWLNCTTTSGSVTLNGTAQSTWYMRIVGKNILNLTCPGYTPTAKDIIKIPAGMQFTYGTNVYEIAEDYTVYYYNGQFSATMLYDITKTVDGVTTTETVSGDYILPEVSKEGYITLGWEIDGKLYKVGHTLAANIDGYEISAVCAEFSQIDGAQVRLTTANKEEQVGGIRFVCKLGSDSKSEHIVQMGMLIIPTNYMTNGELAHANYVAQTEEYGTVKGYREFVVSSDEMTLSSYAQDEEANGADYYYLKGSIVGLYEYNYTRSYSARSFLKVQYADADEPEYIYTDYTKENNARRICDIAKKMIETDPHTYAPIYSKTYPIVYEYAKVADTMESFAYYGPQIVVTDNDYDVKATKTAMEAYAKVGFKYFLCEQGYHVDNTYASTTLEYEQNVYDNPRLPAHNLKQTMQIAKECGLEVVVLDWSLNKLTVCDIPLVETDSSSDQILAICYQTDGSTVELIGSAIDESLFVEADNTYDGGTVLHYVKQFETYDDLKDWVSIKMSVYAQEDNFRGIRLDDEPEEKQFAAVALMTKVVKDLYPNAYVQTSGLQNYRWESGGTYTYNDGHSDWQSYWNTLLQEHNNYKNDKGNLYVTEAGINFYPYAFFNEGVLWDDYNHRFRTNYLTTLHELAETTRDNGINLEFTIQSYAVDELYTNVSKTDLDLQAHLALAFGTKTLGYFRYTGAGELETGQTDRYITQDIVSDENLQNAILYANKNGNYMKAHMTFFEYQGTKVYGTSSYVTTDSLEQLKTLQKDIFTVSGAPVLVNEFYNEYTGQYGYYVVNLTELNDEDGEDVASPTSVTITLTQECLVYQNYQNYTDEATHKAKSITLSGGQGAFIVVE